jgi:hypothetical protein
MKIEFPQGFEPEATDYETGGRALMKLGPKPGMAIE